MHLVDRDRARVVVLCASFLDPALVLPLVLRAVDDRRRLRRHLGRLRDRVGAELHVAGLRAQLVLVARAFLDTGDEELPDARRAERAHRVDAPVPVVEVADDADRARAWRPDRERRADDAVDLEHVRAELLVQLLVPPLCGEVEVELADRRQEAVRVVELDGRTARIADLGDFVDGLLACRDHAHVLRPRTERAHDHVAVRRVRAEQMVRIRMVAPDDRFDFVFQGHADSSRGSWSATQTDARAEPARPEDGADKRRLNVMRSPSLF